MKLYVHYDDEWKGFEIDSESFKYIEKRALARDMKEAAKNSLKILNPEVIQGKRGGFEVINGKWQGDSLNIYYHW